MRGGGGARCGDEARCSGLARPARACIALSKGLAPAAVARPGTPGGIIPANPPRAPPKVAARAMAAATAPLSKAGSAEGFLSAGRSRLLERPRRSRRSRLRLLERPRRSRRSRPREWLRRRSRRSREGDRRRRSRSRSLSRLSLSPLRSRSRLRRSRERDLLRSVAPAALSFSLCGLACSTLFSPLRGAFCCCCSSARVRSACSPAAALSETLSPASSAPVGATPDAASAGAGEGVSSGGLEGTSTAIRVVRSSRFWSERRGGAGGTSP